MSELKLDPGDSVRVTATFPDGDPDTVTFQVRAPALNERSAGALQEFVYGADDDVVRDSAGVYHVDFTASARGTHVFRAKGVGTGIDSVSLTVQQTNTAAIGCGHFVVGAQNVQFTGGVTGSNGALDVGDTLRFVATFSTSSVNGDPSSVTFASQGPGPHADPLAPDVSFTYGVDSEVTRLAEGVYQIDLPLTDNGRHWFRIRGAGEEDVQVTAARVGDASAALASFPVGVGCGSGMTVSGGSGGDSATFIGPQGPAGPQGPTGATGATGPTGPAGPANLVAYTEYTFGSGTHDWHEDAVTVEVELVNGGGGGGGCDGGSTGAAAAGGGGEGSLRTFTRTSVPGSSSAYSVGAGGSPGIGSGGGDGGNGGVSTLAGFTSPSQALGGQGMVAATGTTITASNPNSTNCTAGGFGIAFGVVTTGSAVGGKGGDGPWGGGGNSRPVAGGAALGGVSGQAPGAGGSGAQVHGIGSNVNGGAGALGIIIIREFGA